MKKIEISIARLKSMVSKDVFNLLINKRIKIPLPKVWQIEKFLNSGKAVSVSYKTTRQGGIIKIKAIRKPRTQLSESPKYKLKKLPKSPVTISNGN